LLAAEVVVDGGDIGPGAFADLGQGGAAVAVFGEDRTRAVHQFEFHILFHEMAVIQS